MEELIKKAYEEAVKWFQDFFQTDFLPPMEISNFSIPVDMTIEDGKIIVNKRKLLKYIKKMNFTLTTIYKKKPNDVKKEISARFVHELTEAYARENPLKFLDIFLYLHMFAEYIEDIYRKENKLAFHAHSYKTFNLEKKFEKFLKENELYSIKR